MSAAWHVDFAFCAKGVHSRTHTYECHAHVQLESVTESLEYLTVGPKDTLTTLHLMDKDSGNTYTVECMRHVPTPSQMTYALRDDISSADLSVDRSVRAHHSLRGAACEDFCLLSFLWLMFGSTIPFVRWSQNWKR